METGVRFIFSIGENASCIAFQLLGLRLGLGKRLGFITLPAAVARGGGTPEPDSESALFKKIIKGDFFKHSGFDQISTSESHQLLLIST